MIPSTPENIQLVTFIKISKANIETYNQAIDDYMAWIEILNNETEEGDIIDSSILINIESHQQQISKLKEMKKTAEVHVSGLMGRLYYNCNIHIVENMDLTEILNQNDVHIEEIKVKVESVKVKKSFFHKILKSILSL